MKKPVIKKKLLSELNLNDSFFNSFKETYFEFEKWFKKKQKSHIYGFLTEFNGNLTSLLILKVENNENYQDFEKEFKNKKRLKISTFKVLEVKKKIGTNFLNIVDNYAKENNVEEIYLTVFEGQQNFINFIEKNGYHYYCNKNTKTIDGTTKKERVYIKEVNYE